MGERVRFPLALRAFECHPFLFCRDVALVFGAKAPPDNPPQWVLDSIQEWQGPHRQAPGIEAKRAPEARPTTHTGYAGRPTSKLLIKAEYHRREAAGETANTLAEEARQLVAWFKKEHPSDAQPAFTSVENHIRGIFKNPRNRPPK